MVLQSAVTWIKTSCCVESSDYRARRRAFFMTLRSTMFWFTEPWIGAPNTNGSLIWNNFQDQTFTAKVAISPKNIGKMPQNLLRKLFWKINLIKMMKILICEHYHIPESGVFLEGYGLFYCTYLIMPWIDILKTLFFFLQ